MSKQLRVRLLAEQEVEAGAGGVIRRPISGGEIEVAYMRPNPGDGMPVVFLPGGPGLASAVPYRVLRRRAVQQGLDVVMMEHRGIGLSRGSGTELQVGDVTAEAAADDLAAIFDAAGIDRAVIYGSSYGSYLAQMFGARHPGRVASMVLDSPVISAQDIGTVRAFRRDFLWTGNGRAAQLFRELLDAELVPVSEASHVVQVVYEFAGAAVLERVLAARLAGRGVRVWRRIAALGSNEISGAGQRFIFEPDLVAGITYGQLAYGDAPDGLPLDPQEPFSHHIPGELPRYAQSVDLTTTAPLFTWPTVILSGERDLRTPRPIAEQVVALIPQAHLVPISGMGHSALDTHQLASLHAAKAMATGHMASSAEMSAQIQDLPRRGISGKLGLLISAALRIELALPNWLNRAAGGNRSDHTPARSDQG